MNMKTKQDKVCESAILAGINDDRKALGWIRCKSYAAIEWSPSECVIRDAIIAALKTPKLKRLVEIAAMDEDAFAVWMTKVYCQSSRDGKGTIKAMREALGLSPAQRQARKKIVSARQRGLEQHGQDFTITHHDKSP